VAGPKGQKRITKLLLIREGVHSQLVSFVEKNLIIYIPFKRSI
jgi:hypothetical protein